MKKTTTKHLLFYSRETNNTEKRLLEIVKSIVPRKQIKIFRTVRSLTQRVCRRQYDVSLIILRPENQKELSDLVSLREDLNFLRIIIILPDSERATAVIGHQLAPRYLSYADSDFKDIEQVLCKMTSSSKWQEFG